MIIDILLDLFQGVLEFVIGLFPETGFNPIDKLSSAFSQMGALNYFIPIAELAALIVSIVILFPAFVGGSLFMWIVAFLRGGSSRG